MHRLQGQESDLQGSLEWSAQGTFREVAVFNPRTQRGHLQPGQWDYFEMVLDPLDTSWMVRHSCLPRAARPVLPSILFGSVLNRGFQKNGVSARCHVTDC